MSENYCHDKKTRTDGSLENVPVDKIPKATLQADAEQLYEDRITNGNGKMSGWEFQVLRKTGLLKCSHDKGFIGEERCEVKVSRTVLKTSGSGDTSA